MSDMTTEKMLARIDKKWSELHAFLSTLDDAQITGKTDAAGWTIKDHMIHLALWEDNLMALLDGRDRAEAMGVPAEVWKQGSDAANAITQARHQAMPLAEVRQVMAETHARMLTKIGSMTTEEILLPYRHYQPTTRRNAPVAGWIDGNTAHHYADHLKWIKAIAAA